MSALESLEFFFQLCILLLKLTISSTCVEAWTFAVNAATSMIGSPSAIEGKDKESW